MHTIRFGATREYFEVLLPSNIKAQNWAEARVRLAVEGFTGEVAVFFDKEDFGRFATQLKQLNQSLSGTATLEPLDRQVSLTISTDLRGHIKLEGELCSHATFGNKLTYELELDQTYLQEPLAQLQEVITVWAEE